MAAYFLAEITVHHPKKMEEYASKVGATIAKHEGVLLYGPPENVKSSKGRLVNTRLKF